MVDWPGTLLLVSHDRAFIDHVVTHSTLVFEGGGRVQEYVGGYADWVRQRRHAEPVPKRRPQPAAPTAPTAPVTPQRRKLSYREQQELDQLPEHIDELEAEQQRLQTAVADPAFYKEPAETIHQTLARLDTLQQSILDGYARWDELDARTPS